MKALAGNVLIGVHGMFLQGRLLLLLNTTGMCRFRPKLVFYALRFVVFSFHLYVFSHWLANATVHLNNM